MPFIDPQDNQQKAEATKTPNTMVEPPCPPSSGQLVHERIPVRGDNKSPQEHLTTPQTYTTRSGRIVRKPTKYT